MHWGWPITREAPAGEKKKAEIPQRQKHQTLPTPPPALSLGISQWTLLPSSASSLIVFFLSLESLLSPLLQP